MPPTFNSGVVMMFTVLVVPMMEVFIIKHHIMLTMMKITVTFFVNSVKQMLDISMVVVTVLDLVSMSWMSVTVSSSEAADCRHPGKGQDHYHCPQQPRHPVLV